MKLDSERLENVGHVARIACVCCELKCTEHNLAFFRASACLCILAFW